MQKFTIPIIPAFRAGLKEKQKEKEKDINIDQGKEKEKEYGIEEELLNAKFKEIAEILNIPLQGKIDDQGRRIAIQAGVAIALIHIFETRDLNQITKLNSAISSLFNIIQAGSHSNSQSHLHPHYEKIQECNGIEKIFELFKKNISKFSRDRAALIIGYLFRARKIPDPNMRTEIISYLKICVNDTDVWIKDQAKWRIKDLMLNPVNRAEVEKDGFAIPK
ncbi:MAG: hypothetical protein EZS28_023926 [Streblomastix strix]|uniref:Uncharacterized protein n=1 Tax=Streblomastix strix TaxID=222440 RepID=A0A5J4VDC9_9EUKA|nr:MAG: hypothetical protein EZS28_023926 [Streblomastix strix]